MGKKSEARALPESIGVCIKDTEHTVTYQNETCKRLCSIKEGSRCNHTCLGSQGDDLNLDRAFDEGSQLHRNIEVGGKKLDVVVIHNGQSLSTLLIEKAEHLNKQIETLEPHGLTKMEMQVVRLGLEGVSNCDIALKFNISKSTVRTHLNNAYKKIPFHQRRSIQKQIFQRKAQILKGRPFQRGED